jgi:hypothetical protein
MSVLSTFGFGRLPDDAKLFATSDKFIVKLESVWASITFHDFSSGIGYSSWKRKWFVGSLALTQERLLAYRGSSRLINIPFSDGRFAGLDFSGSDARTIDFVHDASLFRPNWSGKLRYRFRSPDAGFIVTEILSRFRQAQTS